jgi:DNA-directed RNA polymerase specialized sigma24 family protein
MTGPQTPAWPSSPLAAVGAAFATLTAEPGPLTFDCTILDSDDADRAGLPAGPVPLPMLRDWMLAHPHAYDVRDRVWRELITRARTGDPAWVVAAVGMALPALVRFAGRLAAGYRGDPDDLDAELLTGYLHALRHRVDLDDTGLYAKLCYAAWRAARAARLADQTYLPVDDLDAAAGTREPRLPYGHPDLLVARAAALGVIDHQDAELFIEVRLARRAVEPAAARAGLSPDAARMRLARAAARLADALTTGQLSGVVSAQAADQLAAQAAHRVRTRGGRAARAGSRSDQ